MSNSLSKEMQDALSIDAELCAQVPCSGPSDIDAYRHQYNYSRAYWNTGGPTMRKTINWQFKNGQRIIPCKTLIPSSIEEHANAPAIFFFHGGGWIVGNLQTHDRMMREIADRSGQIVIGVEYELSPESNFPTSHNDAIAVVRHIIENPSPYGVIPNQVSICGDSAGAHMSLNCAQKLSQSHPGQLRSMCLIYGAYGLRDSVSRRTQGCPEVGLSAEDMRFYSTALLGEGVDPANCGFDLLAEDLSQVCPALITCCTNDPLHDDSVALSAILEQNGIENRLIEYSTVLHGYAHMSSHVSEARETLQECADWIVMHTTTSYEA